MRSVRLYGAYLHEVNFLAFLDAGHCDLLPPKRLHDVAHHAFWYDDGMTHVAGGDNLYLVGRFPCVGEFQSAGHFDRALVRFLVFWGVLARRGRCGGPQHRGGGRRGALLP